ncbi:hypothetical protein PR048_011920 [Dryococelus australis]|uniref:Uncharacterized protein n=1 Tax=Dryococelus australis TaxID=614101 RepID=A0ABQ9HN15_9NEOP|nr:hypothetical protein PR048_011920 [Dryococelus australis]
MEPCFIGKEYVSILQYLWKNIGQKPLTELYSSCLAHIQQLMHHTNGKILFAKVVWIPSQAVILGECVLIGWWGTNVLSSTRPSRNSDVETSIALPSLSPASPLQVVRPYSCLPFERSNLSRDLLKIPTSVQSMSRQWQCSRVLQAPSRTVGFTRRFHTLSFIQATNTSFAIVPQSPVVHTSLSLRTLARRPPSKTAGRWVATVYIGLRPPPRIFPKSRDASRMAEAPVCDASKSRRCRHSHDSPERRGGGGIQEAGCTSFQEEGRARWVSDYGAGQLSRRQLLHVSMGSTGMKGRGKWEIPEKTHRPTTSSGTIPICENPVTRVGIEPESLWWEASRLAAQPLWLQQCLTTICVAGVRRLGNRRRSSLDACTHSVYVYRRVRFALVYANTRILAHLRTQTSSKYSPSYTSASCKQSLRVGWTPAGTPRQRSKSEGEIRATLTRTSSASSLLRAKRAVFPSSRRVNQQRTRYSTEQNTAYLATVPDTPLKAKALKVPQKCRGKLQAWCSLHREQPLLGRVVVSVFVWFLAHRRRVTPAPQLGTDSMPLSHESRSGFGQSNNRFGLPPTQERDSVRFAIASTRKPFNRRAFSPASPTRLNVTVRAVHGYPTKVKKRGSDTGDTKQARLVSHRSYVQGGFEKAEPSIFKHVNGQAKVKTFEQRGEGQAARKASSISWYLQQIVSSVRPPSIRQSSDQQPIRGGHKFYPPIYQNLGKL